MGVDYYYFKSGVSYRFTDTIIDYFNFMVVKDHSIHMISRILESVAIGNFLNFVEFIIQISFTDYIKASYSFITFRNLKVHIVRAIVKHFGQIPFVAVVPRNSQVMLILEAGL